jgi:hypothetical protein
MKSEERIILEVFELKAKPMKVKDQKSPEVMRRWNLMIELGKTAKLATVPETKVVFANLKAM